MGWEMCLGHGVRDVRKGVTRHGVGDVRKGVTRHLHVWLCAPHTTLHRVFSYTLTYPFDRHEILPVPWCHHLPGHSGQLCFYLGQLFDLLLCLLSHSMGCM